MPRFFLLVCSFPRLLFPSSALSLVRLSPSSVQLLLNHNKTAPQPFPQPSNNHAPTTTQSQPNKAKWARRICRAFVRPIVLLPSIRQKTPRPRVNRPCPVLSIIHPSFQPRLNHGKMLHKHFPSIQQPRSIRPFNHNSTSTTPRPRSNRPCPVLSTIHPSVHPLPNRTSTTQPQNKRRARQKCRARRRRGKVHGEGETPA